MLRCLMAKRINTAHSNSYSVLWSILWLNVFVIKDVNSYYMSLVIQQVSHGNSFQNSGWVWGCRKKGNGFHLQLFICVYHGYPWVDRSKTKHGSKLAFQACGSPAPDFKIRSIRASLCEQIDTMISKCRCTCHQIKFSKLSDCWVSYRCKWHELFHLRKGFPPHWMIHTVLDSQPGVCAC